MPSLRCTPLTGAALKAFYVRQAAETEDTCTYTDKSSSKQDEDVYLSDTILDQVLSCDDFSCSSETSLDDHHTVLPSVLPSSLDSTRKRQENETSMPYEDEQYEDTMIVSNDGVNSRIGAVFENTLQNHKRFKSNHAYHEQGEEQQETGHSHPTASPTAQCRTIIPLNLSLMSNRGNSNYDGQNGQDTTSVHDDSSFLSDEDDEAMCRTNNDTTTPSVPLTEGKQGCEIKQKKIERKRCSFEERFEQLEAYMAKHGHSNVKTKTGENKSLGRWCSKVRQSAKKMRNNEAPIIVGLLEEHIQRLEDIGFDCNPKRKGIPCSFEKRFEQLEAYKAKHGNCNVKKKGNHLSLGQWCSHVRQSVKKMKNSEVPIVAGLSGENIQRLEDIGFNCTIHCTFEKHFNELEAYKAKHGHCKVNTKTGDDKSLGRWCAQVRHSVKKMKNNEEPIVSGLTEENIQRLEDIGFNCNPKRATAFSNS